MPGRAFGKIVCPYKASLGGVGACSSQVTQVALLTDASGTGTLQISSGGIASNYLVRDVYVVMNGAAGMVGGVMPIANALAAERCNLGHTSSSLCSDPGLTAAVEGAAEILSDGTDVAGQACDAISFGLQFSDSSALEGGLPAVTCPCPDGGL